MSDADHTPIDGVPIYIERRIAQTEERLQQICAGRHERASEVGRKALRLAVESRELLLDTIGRDGSRWRAHEAKLSALREESTRTSVLRDILIVIATATVTAALSALVGRIF